MASRSPLPWLHIAEVVAQEAVDRGYRRLGLTGTAWLVDSEVYPEKLAARGIACELVAGIRTPESVQAFQRVIEHMKQQACDAVILGCTEIPLMITDANSPLPKLDSTRLLARAALRRAG